VPGVEFNVVVIVLCLTVFNGSGADYINTTFTDTGA